MNPVPAMPMLGGTKSGKVYLVIGLLIAVACAMKQQKPQPTK